MSASPLSETATADAHRAFEAALTRIDASLRYYFRRWPCGRRDEAIDDARSATWVAWHGLLRRGKDPVAVGVTAIATNAGRAIKKGRAIAASRPVGLRSEEVHSPRALRPTRLRVVSFEELPESTPGAWQGWLAPDRRYGPADEAAFRLDFAAWLDALPPRKRRAAELLAEGHGTGEVARILGVTPGAVSQARAWLFRSWGRFQGEVDADVFPGR
jgi:DNA-directed RNA polymerase specialized sigma24 family protein